MGVEPKVVRNHLFKPHPVPGFDCVTVGRRDHCHFLRTIGIAVDELVIADLGHGLHRLSVSIKEPHLAVGKRLRLGSEKHGRETVLYSPDVQALVAGHHYRCATLGLEEQAALVVLIGKVFRDVVADTRLQAVKESVLHGVLLLSLVLNICHRSQHSHRHRPFTVDTWSSWYRFDEASINFYISCSLWQIIKRQSRKMYLQIPSGALKRQSVSPLG